MASILFHPVVAVRPETGELVRGAEGQIFAETDTSFSNPLPVTDALGSSIGVVSVGPSGLTQAFRVQDNDRVVWKSGPIVLTIWSPQGITDDARATREAAEAAAQAAAEAAAASGGGATVSPDIGDTSTNFVSIFEANLRAP